jgi:hypothetical protein
MASLAKLEPQSVFIPDVDAEVIECDLAIIGGGPAGLTAGIYGNRSGLNTVIIERDALGGQVATTPVVENYPGIAQIGGKSLVDIMVQHALQYGQIFPGEEVMEIAAEDLFVHHHQPPPLPGQSGAAWPPALRIKSWVPQGEDKLCRPGGELLFHLRRSLVQGPPGAHGGRRRFSGHRGPAFEKDRGECDDRPP